MIVKILLPAKEIPDGSIVTKRTGVYKYAIKKSIKIYGDVPEYSQEIEADPKTRFLVPVDVNITPSICAISADTEMVWETSGEEMYRFLSGKY